MKRVWVCVGCPCSGVCHEVDDTPCDACAGSTEGQDFHILLCPHEHCRYMLLGLQGPEAAEYCPTHGNRLASKVTLVAAMLNKSDGVATPPAAPPRVPTVNEMMSFLATERGLSLLSHWVGIIGATTHEELFMDENVRTLIGREWENMKGLMKGAGFE